MRPHLLFLSHRLPYPPHNGAAIRTFNVLRLLSRHYDITALCFDRRDPATASLSLRDRLDAMAPLGRFEVFGIPQEEARSRLAWDHLRSVVSNRAYTYFIHQSEGFTERLRQVLAERRFDLVHVDSLDLVAHLAQLPLDRVILTHHNVESLLLERRARSEQSMLRGHYLAFQARLLAEAERRWAPQVALNVCVSETDRTLLAAMAPAARSTVVPNGVDVSFFAPSEREREGLVFVGGTSYFPNLDAIRWFASEILPELERIGCAAPATILGRATPAEIAEFERPGRIRLTGYVEDVRPAMDAAACFIAPLRVGGGTRLKLVDAWAMGKAVVSTTIGAEGLAAVEGENILLRDDAQSFARGVRDVLTDRDLRRRLERGARRTAETTYSWEVIESDMVAAYESVRARADRAESGRSA